MNSPHTKHTPRKSKKPSQSMNSPSISSQEFDQKLKKLITRLSRQNICKEHKLIANMNLKLEVSLQHVLKLEELKNLKINDAVRMINRVPFLYWVNDKCKFFFIFEDSLGKIQDSEKMNQNNNKHSILTIEQMLLAQKQLLRLEYNHSQTTVILTGITKTWAQAAISQFNFNLGQHFRSNSYKKTPSNYHHSTCQIVGVNDFWIAIEADTMINALSFKRFIRQRKKAFEEKRDFSFKEDKKRVRIVMQNQDFYTLLVDAMTQKKNIEFTRRLVNPNTGMFPNMCLRDIKKVTAFINEEYQMSLKKINRVLYFPIIFNRPELKQPQQHFTLQDVYSEDRSMRSDMLDSISNMNDLIEKADRGTQAESLGVGTHDLQISTDFIDAKNESYLLGCVREVSPLKSMRLQSENLLNQRQTFQAQNDNNKIKKQTIKTKNKGQNLDDESQSDLDSVTQIQLHQHKNKLQLTNLDSNIKVNSTTSQQIPLDSQQKSSDSPYLVHTECNTLQPVKVFQLNPISLLSVREPQLPAKMLKFSFSVYSQTQMTQINYTKMKRLQAEYQKKSINRLKLAPGIPEEFRQVSYEMRNKELFVQNLLKSMEKSSQKKQFALYY